MKVYAKAFLIAGVILPVFLHMVGGGSMPWWPDTVSLGMAFGAAACAMVWQYRTDRETNRRIWTKLKAVYRRWGAN